MEIPPLRLPKLLQVLRMSVRKTLFFMKEAVPIFIFASCVVFLFNRMGGLAMLEKIARPLVTDFMGLPEKSIQVFIKTLIRRESGATELEHLSSIYTNLQLVVNLLVMTFLTPCINAIIVLFKERGFKTSILIISSVFVYAVLIGAVVNHTCHFLGITFT
jgi:ferrous iron transport protein B